MNICECVKYLKIMWSCEKYVTIWIGECVKYENNVDDDQLLKM